jgi:hypothetical protein
MRFECAVRFSLESDLVLFGCVLRRLSSQAPLELLCALTGFLCACSSIFVHAPFCFAARYSRFCLLQLVQPR